MLTPPPRAWRAVAIGLCVAFAAFGAACSKKPAEAPAPLPAPVPAPAPVSTVQITDVQLGTAVGADRRVSAATNVFRPTDTIYASVVTTGSAPSATLTARFTYQDGQLVNESSQTIAPTGSDATEFHISKPDGWPAGGYEVTILLDGQEADRASFSVEAGG
jgi:hypothetical protein